MAFEQAWRRVEDVVGGGERPQVKPSLALESRSLGVGRRARARGELRRGAEVGYCGGVTSPSSLVFASTACGCGLDARYDARRRDSRTTPMRSRRGIEASPCAGESNMTIIRGAQETERRNKKVSNLNRLVLRGGGRRRRLGLDGRRRAGRRRPPRLGLGRDLREVRGQHLRGRGVRKRRRTDG